MSVFSTHLESNHSTAYAPNQLQALVDMCAKPVDKRSLFQCPLCLKEGQPLRSHLARHLRNVSLFVLPKNLNMNVDENESKGVQFGSSEEEEELEARNDELSDSDRMSDISGKAMMDIPDLETDDQDSMGNTPAPLLGNEAEKATSNERFIQPGLQDTVFAANVESGLPAPEDELAKSFTNESSKDLGFIGPPRLINAHTLKLEVYSPLKQYAMLSHLWEEEEVNFSDLQMSAKAPQMKGFQKIRRFCEVAAKDGYSYVWVDTCCINKASGAELTETINSMYRWYQSSAVCYVFLGDVSSGPPSDRLTASRWFTRGWTLQDLLAPRDLRFYDQQWNLLGTRQTLAHWLHLRTGIGEEILNGGSFSRYSIAQRMSWVSDRVTFRDEDIAYCLLGIFGVHIPFLYGEGRENAFLRLQLEIMKNFDDDTIYSWPIQGDYQPGLLADSPKAFAGCQHTEAIPSPRSYSQFSFTSRGFSINVQATPWIVDTYLVPLFYKVSPSNASTDGHLHGIFLRKLSEDQQYARIKYNGRTFMQLDASYWTHQMQNQALGERRVRPIQQIEVYVRQTVKVGTSDYNDRINGFRIATPELLKRTSSGNDLFTVSRVAHWDAQQRLMLMKAGDPGIAGYLDISPQHRKIKIISLGFDFDFNPVCFVAAADGIGEKPRFLNPRGEYRTATGGTDFQGIFSRSPFDELGWSEVHEGRALEQRKGLWALKGDRITGLTARIGDLATLRIIRGMLDDKVVWDVYLENIDKENMMQRIVQTMTPRFS